MSWKIPKSKHHMGILFIQQTKAPGLQACPTVLGERIRCISTKNSLTDISFNWDSAEYISSPISPGLDRIYPSCLHCCIAYPLQLKENEFCFPPGRIIGSDRLKDQIRVSLSFQQGLECDLSWEEQVQSHSAGLCTRK